MLPMLQILKYDSSIIRDAIRLRRTACKSSVCAHRSSPTHDSNAADTQRVMSFIGIVQQQAANMSNKKDLFNFSE